MWKSIFLAPLILQGLLMFFDEFYFHRKRGLGRWERVGHPMDTLSVIACFLWLITSPQSSKSLAVYVALSMFSCVLVTKDEFIHAKECNPGEVWVHSVLFILHPITLASAAALSWVPELEPLKFALKGQLAVTSAFLLYQISYWNFFYESNAAHRRQ